MGKRAYTPADHAALLASFRENPGNISVASRAAKVDWATAKRAWKEGWPNKPFAAVPIERVLLDELEAARAQRVRRELEAQAKEEDVRVKARADAIMARADEAHTATISRKNTMNLAIVTAKAVMNADMIVEEMSSRMMTNGKPDPAKLAGLTAPEMRAMLGLASRMTRDSLRIFEMALRCERIVAGEPIAVLGVRIEEMSPERMVEELKGISRTMERAQRLGLAAGVKPDEPTSDNSDSKSRAN